MASPWRQELRLSLWATPLPCPYLPKALGPPQHPGPELFATTDPGPGSKHLPFLTRTPFLSNCEDLPLPP